MPITGVTTPTTVVYGCSVWFAGQCDGQYERSYPCRDPFGHRSKSSLYCRFYRSAYIKRRSNINYAQYHQPVGGSYQWNIQGQRQINSNLVASLAYVASHGHDLPFPVDINQVPQGKLAVVDQQFRPYPQYGRLMSPGRRLTRMQSRTTTRCRPLSSNA